MHEKIIRIYNHLLNAGIRESHIPIERFRISMTNKLSLVCFIFTVVYHIYLLYMEHYLPAVSIILIGSVYLIIIWLNHIGKYGLAKIIHTIDSNFGIFIFSCFLSPDAGLYLFILLSPFFIYAFYSPEQRVIGYFNVAMYVVNFLIIMKENPVPSLFIGLDKETVSSFYYINVFMTLIMICILLDYLIVNNANINKELMHKNQSLVISEENTKKLFNDLSESYKSLEQFSYIVSHNLRGPVANLIGLSEVFDKNNLKAESNVEVIEHMGAAATQLDEVIKDLNNILAISRSNINEKTITVNLEEETKRVLSSLKNEIQNLNATVLYDFNEVKELFAIKSFIYSIFYNLTSNSLKYTKKGVAPLITIKSERLRNGILITFSDNGLGIDLVKNREKLFKLYSRLHKGIDGKGLGLYIVKSQVLLLKGTIEIESKLGEGTTFKILFNFDDESA